jgi:uncharacterized membrane protein
MSSVELKACRGRETFKQRAEAEDRRRKKKAKRVDRFGCAERHWIAVPRTIRQAKGGSPMASTASFGGHPIHPILIPFPIALWSTSFAVDVVFYFFRNDSLLLISKFLLAAGCLGALAAAIPGLLDFLGITQRRVKSIARWHAILNVVALLVFATSFYLRTRAGSPMVGYHLRIPFLLSLVGVILISVSGWLGGELAYKHGVGVTPQHDTPAEEVAKERT